MRRTAISYFASHPVAANLLMLLMIVCGLYAFSRLNYQILPNFEIPTITISVDWTGANAKDVELAITTPIETKLRGLDDLEKIISTSRFGNSHIMLEFKDHADIQRALEEVKQEVSTVRNLPPDAKPPVILRVIRKELVSRILVTTKGSLLALRPLVQQFKTELLNRGINEVIIRGLPDQMIAVQVPIRHLINLNTSLSKIAEVVGSHSQDLPAGTIGRGEKTLELKSEGQKRNVNDIAQIPIQHDGAGRLLRVKDIAHVERKARDNQVEIYYHGQPAVEIELKRSQQGSSFAAARIINDWYHSVKMQLPKGVEVHVYSEVWKMILERLNLLAKTGGQGLILVLLVLFVFLNARFAFWIAIGIPVSILAAIFLLYLAGGSVNMVSMFAVIMTLGIIVDDTIVVGEQTFTELQTSTEPLLAAKDGAVKMTSPVMAASLSTAVAFIPLFLVHDIMGQILFAIPLVAICVIIASLLECFLVLPGHLSHSFRRRPLSKPSELRRNFEQRFEHFRQHTVRHIIKWAIEYRFAVVIGGIALFALMLAMVSTGRIPFSLFPEPEDQYFEANVVFVPGTTKLERQQFLSNLTKSLKQTEKEFGKGKKVVQMSLGRLNYNGGLTQENNVGERYASMFVEIFSPEMRDFTNDAFIKQWIKNTVLIPGVGSLSVDSSKVGPGAFDIEVRLIGSSLEILKQASNNLQDQIRRYRGVISVSDDLPYGSGSMIYKLTPQGHALGLTVHDVGIQLRAAFAGQNAQIFHEPNDELEVRVMLPDAQRDYLSSLQQFPILTSLGKTVPLGTVVQLKTQKDFDMIRHRDVERSVKVSVNLDPKLANSNQIIEDIYQTIMPNLIKQYGVRLAFTGSREAQADALNTLSYGLILAITLIYFVLAWVLGSYGWPLVIMAVIPLGLTGAILGHAIMGLDLTLISLFGFFGLSGIVINDSIILVERYKILCAGGMVRRRAIVEAGVQRFRAVILTSVTTVAGLTPLLFERSRQAQFLIPMATSIAFGLMYATFLILLVIPALLTLYERAAVRLAWFRRKQRREGSVQLLRRLFHSKP